MIRENRPDKRRRSIRMPGFDYALPAIFFVTICTHDKKPFLGIVRQDIVDLNSFGAAVAACWKEIPAHFHNVELDEFIVMPNHVHGILLAHSRAVGCRGAACCAPTMPHMPALPLREFGSVAPGSLSSIIRSFKSASARRINQLRRTPGSPVWQRNYYEHIVREERDFQKYRDYIVNNPLKWAVEHENPAAPKRP